MAMLPNGPSDEIERLVRRVTSAMRNLLDGDSAASSGRDRLLSALTDGAERLPYGIVDIAANLGRLPYALTDIARSVALLAPERPDRALALERQSTFVVGPARSGTTILQNALNASQEVFILGEGCFFRHQERGFAAAYNTKHRASSNQETKSTFLPASACGDGTWLDCMTWLSARYRVVGDKIALSGRTLGWDVDAFFEFQCRFFFTSRHIFTFRNPTQAALSAQRLLKVDDALETLEGVVATMLLFLKMHRILPEIRCVFLEQMDVQVFEALSEFLGVDVRAGMDYYQNSAQARHDPISIPDPNKSMFERADQLYSSLQAIVQTGAHALPQIEQKTKDSTPAFQTQLGAAYNDAQELLEDIRGRSQPRQGG